MARQGMFQSRRYPAAPLQGNRLLNYIARFTAILTRCFCVYQTHFWDKGTPAEETVRTFDDLVRCGKIRYGGNSNLCGWMVQKMADITDRLGLNPFISLQVSQTCMYLNPQAVPIVLIS